MTAVDWLNDWPALVGTMAFASTAVLALAPRGIDLLTACVMGVLTAIGGGTLRDLVLDQPVTWSRDTVVLWLALIASLITFYAHRFASKRKVYTLLVYLDGLGASLFAIQGADKTWSLGFGLPLAPVMLGIITAIGGGLIRDVLAGRQTLLMKRELYAIPVSLGFIVYAVWLSTFPQQRTTAALVCMGLIVLFRSASIRWGLTVPPWFRLPDANL